MSALSTDKKPLVDYGVQIRFIKDLHDTGGGYPEKHRGNSATPPSSKYGVAVRVQGISGQPYVVLKDGEKGDSYGVQLKSPAQPAAASPVPSSPYNNSLTRSRRTPELTNPYASGRSPRVLTEFDDGDDFASPLKRPPGDGQAGNQGGWENRAPASDGQVEKTMAGPHAAVNGVEEKDIGEFNEAGLKSVGVGSRGFKPNAVSFTGSLGRNSGKKTEKIMSSSLKTFPETQPPLLVEEQAVAAVDTESLAPINKLISKFNNGTPGGATQTRGRSGARQRLRFDERRRSRSLDAVKDTPPEVAPLSPSSPTPNPYAMLPFTVSTSSSSPMPSSTPANSSHGRSSESITLVTAHAASKPSFKSPENVVAKDLPPTIPKKPEVPAPVKNQGQSSEVLSGDEVLAKQAIYNILKEGSSENDTSVRRKVNLVYDATSSFKAGSDEKLKGHLDEKLKENIKLQEQLMRNKTELQKAQDELSEVRMAREVAESRVRQQEDQLAELQEHLRRENGSESLQTDVMTLQAELAEAAMLRLRQEEALHQRERELTALKGALKEEVESHDQEIEALREQYSQDMDKLRTTMEQVSQSQEQIEEERQRVNTSMLSLEDELDSCRSDGVNWKQQLDATKEELQHTKQELLKSRLEKEEFESELKDLQDSLTAMKSQMPGFEPSYAEDLQRCHDDLQRARADLDKRKAEFDERSAELRTLRQVSEEKEAELRSEIDRLKGQLQKEKPKESLRSSVEQDMTQDLQDANNRLRERLARMTKRHSNALQSSEAEEAVEALEDENRSLKTQLEEAKRGTARLGKERDELNRRLEERDLEREALRQGKADLEEQKRLLDRALEKISKEMEVMMGDSRQSVLSLQTQLEEYRERSRKDLLEAQRSSKDRLAELQRAQGQLKVHVEEVSRLKKDLLDSGEERDSAQLERDLLSSRLKHLESELEAEKSVHTDRSREIRGLEDKIKTLEIELDEERSSVELLNDRIARNREQVDQLRSELMQERSARHDLEMDKSSLERQVKEFKSRLADMEGQTRPSTGMAVLENKIQELEERLLSEERERASIQASHRRMERKLKDLNATLDQERNQHAEQKDQMSLRVKALKRQVDERECEVERLEGVRRKVLRDLEEQQELQEVLQAKVTTLESELKRSGHQPRRSVLGSSNFSSEDEDGFYDNNITSILGESHLQTTNC